MLPYAAAKGEEDQKTVRDEMRSQKHRFCSIERAKPRFPDERGEPLRHVVEGVSRGGKAASGRRHRARQATSPEVKELRSEATALKEVVADLTLENRSSGN